MNKPIVRFKEIAKRITGVSIPIFGVSWTPPDSEREVVRETFIFLEDRRCLYNDFAHEMEDQVAQSVLAIRSELTDALKRLPETSQATACLKAIRAACREYLDGTQVHGRHFVGHFSFMTELGRLRAMIGVQVAYLSVKYGIDVDGDLLRVIPAELRDARLLGD